MAVVGSSESGYLVLLSTMRPLVMRINAALFMHDLVSKRWVRSQEPTHTSLFILSYFVIGSASAGACILQMADFIIGLGWRLERLGLNCNAETRPDQSERSSYPRFICFSCVHQTPVELLVKSDSLPRAHRR